MGKLREWTQEELDMIYDMYYNQKIGLPTISKKVGVSRGTITRLFKRKGWEIRSIQEANGRVLEQKVIDELVRKYTLEKQSLYRLVQDYKISQSKIEKVLKENGVVLRTYVEAKQEGRKYKINDDYFKKQSHNMAYILGLLAADGYISEKENLISIGLITEDIELLEQINKELQNERPIKTYEFNDNGRERSMSKFQTWSAAIKKDLAHYSIVPQKTFKLKPPLLLQSKYYIDFIRGYFDGDGSIWINHRGEVGLDIIGASRDMIYWIREVLVNQYGVPNNGVYTRATDNGTVIYKVSFYGDKVRQVYDILYTPNSLFMKRKKDKFPY